MWAVKIWTIFLVGQPFLLGHEWETCMGMYNCWRHLTPVMFMLNFKLLFFLAYGLTEIIIYWIYKCFNWFLISCIMVKIGNLNFPSFDSILELLGHFPWENKITILWGICSFFFVLWILFSCSYCNPI